MTVSLAVKGIAVAVTTCVIHNLLFVASHLRTRPVAPLVPPVTVSPAIKAEVIVPVKIRVLNCAPDV